MFVSTDLIQVESLMWMGGSLDVPTDYVGPLPW